MPSCIHCPGDICWCEDNRQPVVFYPSDEEYCNELDREAAGGEEDEHSEEEEMTEEEE